MGQVLRKKGMEWMGVGEWVRIGRRKRKGGSRDKVKMWEKG